MSIIPDQPRYYFSQDPQYIKVKALKTFLEREEHKDFLLCNNLIALYGEWGSGKSSIFRTLEKDISTLEFTPLIFEAWKYEKDDNLAFSLLEFILEKIIPNEEKRKTALRNKAWKRLKNFSKGITIKSQYIDLSLASLTEPIEEEHSLYTETEKFISEFQERIEENRNKKRILVMIDDLDRCDDENITNLLSALKLMFSVENVIFICGIDKEAVVKTLIRKYNDKDKAEEYLEKIFSINFNVIRSSNICHFRNDDPMKDLKRCIVEGAEITNPRKLNQALNKYEFLRVMIDRELALKTLNIVRPEQESAIYNYFNVIIEIYLFIKIILLDTKKIKDWNIFTEYKEDYPVVFNEMIILNKQYMDSLGLEKNKPYSIITFLNIMYKIQNFPIDNLFSPELKKEDIWEILDENHYYQERFEKILDKEIEKYY